MQLAAMSSARSARMGPPAASLNRQLRRASPGVVRAAGHLAVRSARSLRSRRPVHAVGQGDGMPTERDVEPPLSMPTAAPPGRVRTVRRDGPKPWAPGESPVTKRNLIVAAVATVIAFAFILPATQNSVTPTREWLKPILDLPTYEVLPSKDAYILSDAVGNAVMVGIDPLGNRLVVQPNGDVFVADNNEGVLPPGLFLGNVRDLPATAEDAAQKLRDILGP